MILSSRPFAVEANHEKRETVRQHLQPQQIEAKIDHLKQLDQIRLSDVFSDREILQSCQDLGYEFRDCDFRPEVALALFVQQVLSRGDACSTVVTKFNKQRKADCLPPVSSDASGYCKARNRLPVALIHQLNERMLEKLENNIPEPWKWNNRDVYLLDGFVLHGADTPANQKMFPQPASQQPGLGFPQVRAVVLTSLATGAMAHYAIGPVSGKGTGETSLFRNFSGKLQPGSILVGDAIFDSFVDAVWLQEEGVDLVFCINGSRHSPFDGRCQDFEEEIVEIKKPSYVSERLPRAQWEQLPKTLTYRIVRFRLSGYRNETVTIVTTLTDSSLYSAREVAALYGFRWDVETDIGAYKTTLDLNQLRCHTAENMVREIAVGVLAYNLVHALRCDAASVLELHPREISFSMARDSLVEFIGELATTQDLMWLIWSASGRLVRTRPGRQEPRAIKKRHVKYPRLRIARQGSRASFQATKADAGNTR